MKRQRLESLDQLRRRLPHMSQTALTAVCADIRTHGLPEPFDRHDLHATRDLLSKVETRYGPVVRDTNLKGKNGHHIVKVVFLNVWSLLSPIVSKGGGVCELAAGTACSEPSSSQKPWTFRLVYFGARF